MQLGLVKARIADGIRDDIPELTVDPFTPDAVTEPHLFAGETTIDPNQTFGSGSDEALMTWRLLVGRQDDAEGQELLDAYLSRTGERSVRAAIKRLRGAPGQMALSGAADDLVVTRIDGYRLYRVGETPYYGAELTIRIIGPDESEE